MFREGGGDGVEREERREVVDKEQGSVAVLFHKTTHPKVPMPAYDAIGRRLRVCTSFLLGYPPRGGLEEAEEGEEGYNRTKTMLLFRKKEKPRPLLRQNKSLGAALEINLCGVDPRHAYSKRQVPRANHDSIASRRHFVVPLSYFFIPLLMLRLLLVRCFLQLRHNTCSMAYVVCASAGLHRREPMQLNSILLARWNMSLSLSHCSRPSHPQYCLLYL